MSLQTRYAEDLTNRGFTPDPLQQQAITALQQLADTLSKRSTKSRGTLFRLLTGPPRITGIYLWGGVGRGKTYLMDLFYDSLNGIGKRRVHYHRFMLDIHEQLRILPKSPNPLVIIGRHIARQTQVLCLDEFHVTDVADAILLSGLLRSLFREGVTLVATSNTCLDDLYLNGLQRERFMQAIHLLKKYTIEIDLQSGQDYRLLHLNRGETYLLASELSQQILFHKFNALAPGDVQWGRPLAIHDRQINTIALADDLVWFDFHELCDTPRAAKDYLELARMFHTVFVSNTPMLADAEDSAAKRFMHLVDALYDHRVKLIMTASTYPAEIYQGRLLKGAFERTVSRLIEMGSEDYLALAHKP